MKIDRMIGILSILLQKEKVTSAELAETFEVSRRTIIRDFEEYQNADPEHAEIHIYISLA